MRMVRNLLALLAVAWSVVPAAAQTPPRLIEWQLKNPFRYFEHAADTRRHADVLATLTPEQRKTPILSSEQRLAAAEKGLGWARHVFRNVKDEPCLYSSRSECSDYLIPKSHTVLLSAPRVFRQTLKSPRAC